MSAVTVNQRYGTLLSNALEMTRFNYAVGGAGYTSNASSLISTQVSNAINRMTSEQKANTAAIIIMGGVNDLRTYSDVTSCINAMNSAIDSIVSSLASNYPNATIFVTSPQYTSCDTNTTYGEPASYAWRNISENFGNHVKRIKNAKVVVISDFGDVLAFRPPAFTSDGLHPNVIGHEILFGEIRNVMLGGQSQTSFFTSTLFSLNSSKAEWVATGYLFKNGAFTIWTGGRMRMNKSVASGASELIGTYNGPLPDGVNVFFPITSSEVIIGTIAVSHTLGEVYIKPTIALNAGATFMMQPMTFIGEKLPQN